MLISSCATTSSRSTLSPFRLCHAPLIVRPHRPRYPTPVHCARKQFDFADVRKNFFDDLIENRGLFAMAGAQRLYQLQRLLARRRRRYVATGPDQQDLDTAATPIGRSVAPLSQNNALL